MLAHSVRQTIPRFPCSVVKSMDVEGQVLSAPVFCYPAVTSCCLVTWPVPCPFLYVSHVMKMQAVHPLRRWMVNLIPEVSSPKRPDSLWGPPSLLFFGYRRSLLPVVELTPRLRTSGRYTSISPVWLHDVSWITLPLIYNLILSWRQKHPYGLFQWGLFCKKKIGSAKFEDSTAV